jgi:YD repeat-containing protein
MKVRFPYNNYGYQYDAAGQRTQETSTVGTRDFTYDDQRQMTHAYRVDGSGNPIPSYNYAYTFDPIGNWTKETRPRARPTHPQLAQPVQSHLRRGL